MAHPITKFFDSQDEAIKEARRRAKSNYHTHYIYVENGKLCIRQVLYRNEGERPILKVTWNGIVEYLQEPNK